MEALLILLFVLFVVLFLVTLIGHGIWLFIRWVFGSKADAESRLPTTATARCSNCNFMLAANSDSCGHCGALKPTAIVSELLKDLAATLRQTERFHRAGVIDDLTYGRLTHQIEAERLRLTQRGSVAAPAS